MSKMTLVCPNLKCKTVLEVDEKMRGQRVRCNKCGQVIIVPKRHTKPR